MAPRNLLNAEAVRKSFGRDPVLDGVSLGVADETGVASQRSYACLVAVSLPTPAA